MLPPDRLRSHVDKLMTSASALAAAADALAGDPGQDSEAQRADRERVAADAHKIISQAGMLGLRRLSGAARELEQVIRDSGSIEPARNAFRDAAGDVDAFLRPLLADRQGTA